MSIVELIEAESSHFEILEGLLNRAMYLPRSSSYISQKYLDKKKYFICKFHEEIARNFQNPDVKIQDIAYNMFITERQLFRKSKEYLNITPNLYLRNFRLDQSIVLIKLGISINIVSTNVGFSSHSYFCRCFKATYRETPSQYFETS